MSQSLAAVPSLQASFDLRYLVDKFQQQQVLNEELKASKERPGQLGAIFQVGQCNIFPSSKLFQIARSCQLLDFALSVAGGEEGSAPAPC